MAYKMLDGNAAAAEAMKLGKSSSSIRIPITPQSSMSENLAEMIAAGELEAEYSIESEHSAMSMTLTAQLTGVRAATATASMD